MPPRRFSALAVPYCMGDPQPEFAVEDAPPLTATPRGQGAMQRMASILDSVAAWVAERVPALVHAPDCMAPIGVVAGLQRAGLDPDLIWLDAHGDFNTPETTPSGYLGGMPLAMLVGRGDQSMIRSLGIRPLSERRVVLVGTRDLDPGEATALAASDVRRLSLAELSALPLPYRPLQVHLDLDVVDPDELPGLLYPARGGPSLAAVATALRHLATAPWIEAVSVAHTYEQSAPTTAAGRRAAADLARALAGG
jgi:arginase